jgi:putative transposase
LKLAGLQRVLSRRTKGSGRWHRQKLKVARFHTRIADARKDYLDKVTTELVRRFDVLCIEDLNVRGMIANDKLARSIGDVGFSAFRRMLEYKADWYGKQVKVVDRFFPSSKRCHCCGFMVEKQALSVREWDCPECKSHHDRDENAAKNILFAGGQPVKARGESVRPILASARNGGSRGSVNRPSSVSVQ